MTWDDSRERAAPDISGLDDDRTADEVMSLAIERHRWCAAQPDRRSYRPGRPE